MAKRRHSVILKWKDTQQIYYRGVLEQLEEISILKCIKSTKRLVEKYLTNFRRCF